MPSDGNRVTQGRLGHSCSHRDDQTTEALMEAESGSIRFWTEGLVLSKCRCANQELYKESMMNTRIGAKRNRVGMLQAMAWVLCALTPFASQAAATLRPPSVPLVACDPYFSIWSPADKLTDADTVHWTGKPHRLTSLVRIDGKGFRLMGKEPAAVPALPQSGLEVLPTRTIYTFEGEGVRLTLTFMTAALPDDLMIYSRPVTYLTWTAQATDGKEHKAEVYFDASAEITVNEGKEPVTNAREEVSDLTVLRVGATEQQLLARS